MEIAFRTKALRTVCLSKEATDVRYGAERGAILRGRLADIRAAECLGDVPLLFESMTYEGKKDKAVIAAGAGLTIYIKANHKKTPELKSGGIDWPRVDRIIIQQIDLSHG